MVFKWNEDSERKLLMLAFKQSAKLPIDADQIIKDWPDDEKPTARTARDRFNQLYRKAALQDFSTGLSYSKSIASTSTPSPQRSSGGGSRNASITSSRPSTTNTPPNSLNGSTTPSTPFTTSKFRSVLPKSSTPKNTNTANAILRTAALYNTATSSKNRTRKRKASAISPSTSDEEDLTTTPETSEDELATPTKSMPPPSAAAAAAWRRASLPRHSKSATPLAAYHLDESDDDGTGKDAAAVEIESEEEYCEGVDEGMGSGKGMKEKKGWRDRGGGFKSKSQTADDHGDGDDD